MMPPLELWGGVECTLNRVGDQTHDQLERTGHAARPGDLDLIAGLGLRTLRYPVLWERVAPEGLDRADWSWPDERLGRLREPGIRPVVGLLHHGHGPRDTSLLAPQFPEKFAAYAQAVATRYPWVCDYLPINEPNITARFCGLYGHWHPHERDPRVWARLLLAQCRATVLAMEAVREVNPDARLIQNEDIGETYSTPRLQYQADFENERRWLTFDLLSGRVNRAHWMWQYLTHLGIQPRDLNWFVRHPCPPDVLGIDYYVTSERFLDDRLEHYPPWLHGGNGRDAYADVEAVRVCADDLAGVAGILRQAWRRYQRPLAVTEAHLGCTEDEQVRWLWDTWQGARSARRAGADVRAVTAWAMFGLCDWDSLLTRCAGCYEPGVFDARHDPPRPTRLAALVRALAAGETPADPDIHLPGWWRRTDRLLYPAYQGSGTRTKRAVLMKPSA